jgi:hypothetical protein
LANDRNVKTIQAPVKLQAAPGVLWKAITDHQALPCHVSMLHEVEVVRPKEGGVGTVRQCTLTGGTSFHEKVTAWEEEHRYCYQPDTDEAPFPFRWAEACWSIEGNGERS